MSVTGSHPLTNLTRHATNRPQPALIDTAIGSLGGSFLPRGRERASSFVIGFSITSSLAEICAAPPMTFFLIGLAFRSRDLLIMIF